MEMAIKPHPFSWAKRFRAPLHLVAKTNRQHSGEFTNKGLGKIEALRRLVTANSDSATVLPAAHPC
jgi:hypothetical protein